MRGSRIVACISTLLLAATAFWAVQPAHASQTAQFKVVGYYPQWGMFNTPAYNVKNLVSSGSAGSLTHLIYAFSGISNNQCASSDDWADTLQPLPASLTVNAVAQVEKTGVLAGNFRQLQELKALYPRLQIMISIGGSGIPAGVFSQAAQPAHREAFVASCIAMYIKGQFAPGLTQPGIFTGIDIDWEFPSTAADRTNYVALLAEFRKQLNALGAGYQLSTVMGSSVNQWQWMDPDVVQNDVDFFNVTMYDMDGPWSDLTGFNAPLERPALDPWPVYNGVDVVNAYLAMGVEKAKIVYGMPLYGYHWTAVPATHNGLYQQGTPDQNSYQYWQIAALTGYSRYRDPVSQEPWLYDASTGSFWTYDDATSMAWKTKYVVSQGLGGVVFWEMSGDTPSGAMFKTVVAGL